MKKTIKCMIPLLVTLYCTKGLAFFYSDIGFGGVLSNTTDSITTSPTKISYDTTPNVVSLPNVTWRNHFKNGFDLNVALGYQFNPCWSAEVELLYQSIERKIGGSYDWQLINSSQVLLTQNNNPINSLNKKAQLYSLLANISYDFYSTAKWSTFIGVGLGISVLRADKGKTLGSTTQISPSLNGNAFTLQFKTGVGYELYKNISLIAQYRLLGTSYFNANWGFITLNPRTNNENVFSTNSYKLKRLITNALELKIRYNFC